jgi:hypothetical protein
MIQLENKKNGGPYLPVQRYAATSHSENPIGESARKFQALVLPTSVRMEIARAHERQGRTSSQSALNRWRSD